MWKTLKNHWDESVLPDVGIWVMLIWLVVLAGASSHGSNWVGQAVVAMCVGGSFMLGRVLVMRRMTRQMEAQNAHLFSAMKHAYVVGQTGKQMSDEEYAKEIQLQNAMHKAPKTYGKGAES